MLWEIKQTDGSYKTMKTPSSYKIDWEDQDYNTYRSVVSFNLVRTTYSQKWFKGSFSFNYLTEQEAESILKDISKYPLTIRIKSPLFGTNGVLETQMYVSKASINMERNKDGNNQTWNNLSFNLIQSKKVGGQ